MTKTEWYDFKNLFYKKYVPHTSPLEDLQFNRFLTWICILAPYFEEQNLIYNIEEFDIQHLINDIEENTNV